MTDEHTILIKPFDGLSLAELHACLKLRGEVFVVDQQICSVPDVDELDPACHHAMLVHGGKLIGTARLLPIDGGAVIKVGRVAIAKDYRSQGFGSRLMAGLHEWIAQVPGRTGLMNAQAHLEEWYHTMGWRREGEVFTEAGIPHLKMLYGSEKRA